MVLIHLSFSQYPKLFSHAFSFPGSLSPNYSAPYPIHSVLALVLSREVVVCSMNFIRLALSDLEQSVNFPPHARLSIM